MHEMGIRMALGAGSQDVLKIVFRHGLRTGIAGVALGLILAGALTRLMSTLLFGVKAIDALAFAGGAGVLLAVAAAASFIPARRAAQADPLTVLRTE
jgi:putative ABC transport system permease protein